MLTIGTTPRPLENTANRSGFEAAVKSWMKLEPTPQVLVFGNYPKVIGDLGATMVENFDHEPDGRPYFNSFVAKTEELAIHPFVMYITDHLIVLPGLMEALGEVAGQLDQFLMMGMRWTGNVVPIDFSNNDWWKPIAGRIGDITKTGNVGAKDWLVWRKPWPQPIPPFIMGMPWYDTWMVVEAQKRMIPRIDATAVIKTVHPPHGFPFVGGIVGREKDPRCEANRVLAEGCAHKGHITDSELVLVELNGHLELKLRSDHGK